MSVLFVVNRPEDWPHQIPGAGSTHARAFLTGEYSATADVHGQVVNLCACDRHQGDGYYVSLLAEARGQRPLPDVKTIEDMHSAAVMRELAARIDESLFGLHHAGDEFELDVYFGHEPSARDPALARHLFALLKVPLLRVQFRRNGPEWNLARVQALTVHDIPPQFHEALLRAAAEYATGQAVRRRKARSTPALAILHDPGEPEPPSDPPALQRFIEAAALLGMRAEVIDRHAIERLEEFDALFIRDTTRVGHYTYQFSSRAASLGLVVIDDPESILQCNNKVYLNELLTRHHVPMPKTLLVHRDNIESVAPTLRLPCILKQPDSAFSLGVGKVENEQQLRAQARRLLESSELIIAQEYLPTPFDWRVGVLDGRPLFVCKYFMAPGHWQVIKRESSGRVEGRTLAMTVGEAPKSVVNTAWRAAGLIGAGLYGVDLKQAGDQCYVIEINDNPNIDTNNEDGVLKDSLYREIMGVFLRRINEQRLTTPP
jgi:glutathione synthase/RimK-type ligase-like ATP-grasp enzyme